MPKKRYKPQETVAKLCQVDVHLSQGSSVADSIRRTGVSEVTYYNWRQGFSGLKTHQIKRHKELEAENARLHRACRVLGQHRSTVRESPHGRQDETRPTKDMWRYRIFAAKNLAYLAANRLTLILLAV